jgi:hypothetical protein
MDIVLSVIIGVGLAASCGFRVFVPLLVLCIAERAGAVSIGTSMSWLTSDFALIALLIASALEIAAYWVPWLDNALDVAATPAAIIAGTIAAASVFSFTTTPQGDMLRWAAAIIVGGGAAAAVQSSTVVLRAASTITTGGFGNPLFATIESGAAIGTSLLAILLPLFFGLVLLLGIAIVLTVIALRRSKRRQSSEGSLAGVPSGG